MQCIWPVLPVYLPALPTLSHATYDTPKTDFGSEALGRKRAPHAPSRLRACSDLHRLLDMVPTSYGDVPSPVLAQCEHAEACVLRFGLVHWKPQASPRASQMRLTLHVAYTELSYVSCVLGHLRRGRLGYSVPDASSRHGLPERSAAQRRTSQNSLLCTIHGCKGRKLNRECLSASAWSRAHGRNQGIAAIQPVAAATSTEACV